jgi:hypothetical protein
VRVLPSSSKRRPEASYDSIAVVRSIVGMLNALTKRLEMANVVLPQSRRLSRRA